LYVIDHDGEKPNAAQLRPYTKALDRVARSCPEASRNAIANDVLAVSDLIEKHTGTRRTTLAILRLFPASKDPSWTCQQAFAVLGVALEGAS
jgi:hypothetical protein